MLNQIKNLFKSKPESNEIVPIPPTIVENSVTSDAPPKIEESPETGTKKSKPKTNRKPKVKIKTAKDIATDRGEPYVAIINVDLDPSNIGNGAFELDWNQFFIAKLIRAGYKGNDDSQIVDQWFQDVCRNVVMETFEQYEANNPRPVSGVQKRDIGSGRTEIS
jgi:hypothetical protein